MRVGSIAADLAVAVVGNDERQYTNTNLLKDILLPIDVEAGCE